MEVVYTTLGLVEVLVLLVSALAFAFLIVRGIFRALFLRKDETQKVPTQEEMRHLKRAGSSMSG
jgi:uncharacterized membrane protein